MARKYWRLISVAVPIVAMGIYFGIVYGVGEQSYADGVWTHLSQGDTTSADCGTIAMQSPDWNNTIPGIINEHFYSYEKHRCLGYTQTLSRDSGGHFTGGNDEKIYDLVTEQNLLECDTGMGSNTAYTECYSYSSDSAQTPNQVLTGSNEQSLFNGVYVVWNELQKLGGT